MAIRVLLSFVMIVTGLVGPVHCRCALATPTSDAVPPATTPVAKTCPHCQTSPRDKSRPACPSRPDQRACCCQGQQLAAEPPDIFDARTVSSIELSHFAPVQPVITLWPAVPRSVRPVHREPSPLSGVERLCRIQVSNC